MGRALGRQPLPFGAPVSCSAPDKIHELIVRHIVRSLPQVLGRRVAEFVVGSPTGMAVPRITVVESVAPEKGWVPAMAGRDLGGPWRAGAPGRSLSLTGMGAAVTLAPTLPRPQDTRLRIRRFSELRLKRGARRGTSAGNRIFPCGFPEIPLKPNESARVQAQFPRRCEKSNRLLRSVQIRQAWCPQESERGRSVLLSYR